MEIFEHFRQLCHDTGVFSESSLLGGTQCGGRSTYRLSPDFGSGWMDITQLGRGMVVGRAAYEFKAPYRQTYDESPESLSIGIVLSGQMTLQHADGSSRKLTGGTLALWKRGSHAGQFAYDLQAGDGMQGISIDLPLAFAQDLLEHSKGGRGGILAELMKEAATHPVYLRMDQLPSTMAARNLLHAPAASTIDQLRMESAALTLLADLMGGELHAAFGKGSANSLPPRHRCAVDDTVEILRTEFAESHTIASLANRVGLNECYLKSAFRTQMGMTIASYLRYLRMQHALPMIEEGQQTIQDVAMFVGYTNPSQFAAAFRKVHGLSPSRLR